MYVVLYCLFTLNLPRAYLKSKMCKNMNFSKHWIKVGNNSNRKYFQHRSIVLRAVSIELVSWIRALRHSIPGLILSACEGQQTTHYRHSAQIAVPSSQGWYFFQVRMNLSIEPWVLHATCTCWQQLWYSTEPVLSDFPHNTQCTMHSAIITHQKQKGAPSMDLPEDGCLPMSILYFFFFFFLSCMHCIHPHNDVNEMSLPSINPVDPTVEASIELYQPCLLKVWFYFFYPEKACLQAVNLLAYVLGHKRISALNLTEYFFPPRPYASGFIVSANQRIPNSPKVRLLPLQAWWTANQAERRHVSLRCSIGHAHI